VVELKRREAMNENILPNWDGLAGKSMLVPLFLFGDDNGGVGPLTGFCRGFGAFSCDHKAYHDNIGIYTAEGVYYNIRIDTRMTCAIPQFFIDSKPFFYPITSCFMMCGGVPCIDPTTGIMQTPKTAKE